MPFQLSSNAYATSFTVTSKPVPGGESQQKNVTSKAMQAYLERAQEHDQFMKAKDAEFRIGKRHLANMMGEDPETFTQEDIDVSCGYHNTHPLRCYELFLIHRMPSLTYSRPLCTIHERDRLWSHQKRCIRNVKQLNLTNLVDHIIPCSTQGNRITTSSFT